MPAQLVIYGSTGNNLSTSVDTGLPETTAIQVQVRDSTGHAVPNVYVTFSAPTTGASLNFGNPIALAETSQAVATLNGPYVANGITGSYQVTASIGNVKTAITVTNTPGPNPVASLSYGSPFKIATIYTQFPDALSVTPLNANGNCLAQVPISFSAPTSGPSATLSGATVKSGAATCEAHVIATANGVVGGPYNIRLPPPGASRPPSR